MALTFRSSTPEARLLVEREPDGRQRVARATKDPDAFRQWDLRVEHPSGQIFNGTFRGDSSEVNIALAQMLARTEHEWKEDKSRGDRPHGPAPDRNVRVHDDGRFVEPTMIPRR